MIKKYKNKNKFKENVKSISLRKINPYYENKSHYLPYKYTDPSFKIKYKGPLMQKDLYILNLIDNRINKKKSFLNNSNNNKFKNKNQVCPKLSPNIAVTTELIFNSDEIDKKKANADYLGYITNLIKNKFFNFNPISTKKKLIQYREYLFKDIPTYKGKPRKINSDYLNIYRQKMREQSYINWNKLKAEYMKRDISEDKYLQTDYNYDYKDNNFFKNKFNNTQKCFSVKKEKKRFNNYLDKI